MRLPSKKHRNKLNETSKKREKMKLSGTPTTRSEVYNEICYNEMLLNSRRRNFSRN